MAIYSAKTYNAANLCGLSAPFLHQAFANILMRTRFVAIVLFGCISSAYAAPYPLGTMTCEDIGAFASEAMSWRKAGVPKEQALARLEDRTYNDPVEKKNLTAVVEVVYGPYGRNWSVEGAGNVMRGDCRAGREGQK